MRLVRNSVSVAVLGAALSIGAVRPASVEAAPLDTLAQKIHTGEVMTDYSQFRRYRGRSYGRGYYGRPYAGRYYRRGSGAAAAGLIGGLAAGAIIGGAIASQQAQAAPVYVAPENDAVAYCMQRFRSYDPASGTYLGYDGLRHPCP
jgi:hypothetical protein